MGNRWRCDGVIQYIIWEMVSMWCGNWWHHLRNRTQSGVVIRDSSWEIGHNVMLGNWRQHMGNMWHSDGAIDYIMQEMMSIWCGKWWQHLGNRTQCDMVIGGSTWVIGGDVIGLLITSSRKWCRCDVVIGDSTWVIGGDVMGLLTTSSGKWCRCDMVIGGSTRVNDVDVMW